MRDTWYEAEIEDYPQAEQGKVQVDEPHASGKLGDRVGNAHIERRGDLLAVLSHLRLPCCYPAVLPVVLAQQNAHRRAASGGALDTHIAAGLPGDAIDLRGMPVPVSTTEITT